MSDNHSSVSQIAVRKPRIMRMPKEISENPTVLNEKQLFQWAKELFPMNRSLSGEGVRETLSYLRDKLPELEIHNLHSGDQAFDWKIPKEWKVIEAYIEDCNGNRVIDYAWNNLHLVGYSVPTDCWVSKAELETKIHYLQDQPDSIPYVTSYYKEDWGFCVEFNRWKEFPEDLYHVVIQSELFDGSLNYGEIYLSGTSNQEILLSSYICHPSMFSNEVSGPVILTALFIYLKSIPERHYSYRGLLLPETIGSIGYMHENLKDMQQRITAGWVLTCLADEGEFSYIPSRLGRNYADRMTLKFAEENETPIKHYSWLDRGSDERQYCSPGVDLPICSVTRTKYGEFPEYHTSADNLEFGSPKGLFQSFTFYRKLLNYIELRRTPKATILCEPQMGRRNLYPKISKSGGGDLDLGGLSAIQLTNFLSYADGQHNLAEISELCQASIEQTVDAFRILERENLILY